MSDADALEVRIRTYRDYLDQFSSAPIRLMSRTASRMRALGYPDLATAIGDLDWRTVPTADSEDPRLREDWRTLLDGAFGAIPAWLGQLGEHPLGYNLDSVGHPTLCAAFSALWQRQLGLRFENRPGRTPELYLFHGGNQCLQAALIAVAERRRNRVGADRPATMLVPVPSFSCPLDQIALQGMRAALLPPRDPGMDPSLDDLADLPDDLEVDGVYLMPITNPTGRTLEPDRLRAFVGAILDRWPHAAVILDSVYVRLHPRYRELLAWYESDPRFAGAIVFLDSLSKTHGVTGLRSGALLTRADDLGRAANRYAQNVMAGPSNVMQAAMLGLLAPFATGDVELQDARIRLALRIGRHLQRRRRVLLERIVEQHRELLATEQPVLPDSVGLDWEGSMYAVLRIADGCVAAARDRGVPPTVELYLQTGVAGVPLDGFCRNPNLEKHGLLANPGPRLSAFQEEASRYVRLSFGMTAPPA